MLGEGAFRATCLHTAHRAGRKRPAKGERLPPSLPPSPSSPCPPSPCASGRGFVARTDFRE